MTYLDDLSRLHHIRDAAITIARFIHDEERESLERDEKLAYSLIHLVTVIGEASARLSELLTSKYPNVPWAAIVGMRNRLVHGYFEIDYDRLWQTVTYSVPQLLTQVEQIIATEPPGEE